MESKTIFVDGLMFKKRREKAPEWIKGHASMKIADFITWLKVHGKGKEWLNFDLCQSNKGTLYFKLDTFQPQAQQTPQTVETKQAATTEDQSYQNLYNSF